METDSLDITRFLGMRYPQLMPSEYREVIESLLEELHQVWYISLSFSAEERRGEGILNMVKDLMAQPTSSEKYKAALQRKLDL